MPQNGPQTSTGARAAATGPDAPMQADDVVWWLGGAPCRPCKVRLREPDSDGWVYETVGGATGWRARASRSDLVSLSSRERNGDPR